MCALHALSVLDELSALHTLSALRSLSALHALSVLLCFMHSCVCWECFMR